MMETCKKKDKKKPRVNPAVNSGEQIKYMTWKWDDLVNRKSKKKIPKKNIWKKILQKKIKVDSS